jgi:hypothetical protein
MKNPDLVVLRDIILHPAGPGHEFGEALIEYAQAGKAGTLIVLSDRKLGYYLKYLDATRSEWLSLGDKSRLSEVVCPDDWQASAGLFLAPDDAWNAIREFSESGQKSVGVTWIRPQDMPPDGNW